MPVHDWTRVEADIFHDFHLAWTAALRSALNEGLLPEGYYALIEQHAGRMNPDVFTLHASPEPEEPPWLPPDSGGIDVAEAPRRVLRKQIMEPTALARRRSLAIRHVSGHRLIALIEIVSPANKGRNRHVAALIEKAVSALERGVHLLLVDLFPPGPHDIFGIHGQIVEGLDQYGEPYDLPTLAPLTLASYVAGPSMEAYLEHLAVGAPLADMPLFLRPDRYVYLPLEPTYQTAYRGMPAFCAMFSKDDRRSFPDDPSHLIMSLATPFTLIAAPNCARVPGSGEHTQYPDANRLPVKFSFAPRKNVLPRSDRRHLSSRRAAAQGFLVVAAGFLPVWPSFCLAWATSGLPG